jgi:isopentenyl-diphosphate delta-isomerase
MSQKQETLILVDDKDNQIGTETRENCHLGNGLRHRAYVVFLFHSGKLLLQQRSKEKLLWPGYWDVSFTSHVYPGETYIQAARRKCLQELNAHFQSLKDVYSFVYEAPFGKYSENEFCKLLVGNFDGEMEPNPREILDFRYAGLEELQRDLRGHPEFYTPWFKLAFDGFMKGDSSAKYKK